MIEPTEAPAVTAEDSGHVGRRSHRLGAASGRLSIGGGERRFVLLIQERLQTFVFPDEINRLIFVRTLYPLFSIKARPQIIMFRLDILNHEKYREG
ncbi:MAG: hypothetical protein ACLP51_21165 [Syntrophobacteraceae bacterium]